MQRIIVIILILCGSLTGRAQILPSFGDSRTGTTGLQFLKIAPDARSTALAGSYNAMANDVSAVFWNPAGLTMVDTGRYHVQFGHTAYFAGVDMNYCGLAFTRDYYNFWGLSIINLSSGDMPVTTEFHPFGNGQTFSAQNMLIGLSFGKVLSNTFSMGVSAKYVYEDIAGIKMHNGIFDFGFIYSIGSDRRTRFAVGISNFGFNVSPNGKISVTTLNGEKEEDNFENVAVPSVFRLGIASKVIDKGNHALTLSAQLSHPTDNNETLAMGAEYALKNLLFLRTGYELGTDVGAWPSAGIGLRLQRNFGNIFIDYSFNNKDFLGSINRLTLGISLL